MGPLEYGSNGLFWLAAILVFAIFLWWMRGKPIKKEGWDDPAQNQMNNPKQLYDELRAEYKASNDRNLANVEKLLEEVSAIRKLLENRKS